MSSGSDSRPSPMALMESQKGRFEASFLPHLRTFLSLSCALWSPRVLRVAPVDRLQQITHLRPGQPRHTAHRHRPDKTSTIQPLGVERNPIPSCHKALISEPPRPRNTKTSPANGSRPRLSCTSKARPCM